MQTLEIQTMDRECEYCGKKIPHLRLKVLPNTTTCVKCSEEQGYIGIITTDERADGIDVHLARRESDDSENHYRKKKRHRREEDDD